MKPKAEYYLYSMTINLNAIPPNNRTDKAGYKNKNYKYNDYVILIDKLNNYLKEYDKKVCICFSISHLSMSKKHFSKYHVHASIMGLDYHEMEITKLAIKDFFKDNYSICKKNGNTLNNVLKIKGYNPSVTEFKLYKDIDTYNYLWYLFYQIPQAIGRNKIYNNTNYIITDSSLFTKFLLRNRMINQRFEPTEDNIRYWVNLIFASVEMKAVYFSMYKVLEFYHQMTKKLSNSPSINLVQRDEVKNYMVPVIWLKALLRKGFDGDLDSKIMVQLCSYLVIILPQIADTLDTAEALDTIE